MKKCISVLLVLVMLLVMLPMHTYAADTRIPIYLGYAEIDYMAEEILREIPTQGKTDKEKIRAVYDWIIKNCRRDSWDGTYYFTEAELSPENLESYYHRIAAKIDAGEVLLRAELESYAGIQGDMFWLSYDSRDYVANFAYEMMILRAGNCAHYSALLTVLLGHLGYDCRLIDGVFINRDGSKVEHKWNYVLLDGKYYWLDVRMDHSMYNSTGSIGYYYFMEESTNTWAERHEWDHSYSDWLAANAGSVMRDVYGVEMPAAGSQQTPVQPDDPWGHCSDWARETMRQAGQMGLIPESLRGADLTQGITRQEFAAIAVRLYEQLSGMPAPDAESPFTDTQDADVARAAALGVVNGIGNGRYGPGATLTREQAVTMMGRVCELVNFGMVADGSWLAAGNESILQSFADGAAIAAYARSYVAYFAGTGVVNGMGDGRFAPQGTMTREQAIKVALVTVNAE